MSTSKPGLSVSFHNFWPGFDAATGLTRQFFLKALAERYSVTVEEAGRDLQISSIFGSESLPKAGAGRPLRVWWTGEPREPHSQIFDLYFGFRPTTPLLGSKWHRYPFWILAIDWWDKASTSHVERLLAPRVPSERSQFCNFIYSRDASIRAEFFLRLNEVRHVGSFGRVLNNEGALPDSWEAKMEVLRQSTFTIAFENTIAPGYVTEKLVQPLLAGSIPIYWGAREALSDFNPDAFIAADNFSNMDDLVRHVVGVTNSPETLSAMASAPAFSGNRISYEHTPQFFVDRISEALSGSPDGAITDRLRALWQPQQPSGLKSIESKIRKVRDTLRAKVSRTSGLAGPKP
jgi:hypothetical protein